MPTDLLGPPGRRSGNSGTMVRSPPAPSPISSLVISGSGRRWSSSVLGRPMMMLTSASPGRGSGDGGGAGASAASYGVIDNRSENLQHWPR